MDDIQVQVSKDDLQKLLQKLNKIEAENQTLKKAGFMLLEIIKLSGLNLDNLKGLNMTSITSAVMRLMSRQGLIENLIDNNKNVFSELKQIYDRERNING